VLSDYLQHLYDCSRDFIEDTHPDGVSLWKSLHGDAQFILSHPTTWGGNQHDILRKCMVQSGLLPSAHSSRMAFVSEGEANLHYIMRHKHELGLNGDVSYLDTHSLRQPIPHTYISRAEQAFSSSTPVQVLSTLVPITLSSGPPSSWRR
jgi:hypothetical protein